MDGSLDYETGTFTQDGFTELDGGFDFYAAQVAKHPDGRTIMIAWMQMWDRTMPTQVDGWAGAFTLPRELSLYQWSLIPTTGKRLKIIEKIILKKTMLHLRMVSQTSITGVSGNKLELEVEIDLGNAASISIDLLKGTENYTENYL